MGRPKGGIQGLQQLGFPTWGGAKTAWTARLHAQANVLDQVWIPKPNPHLTNIIFTLTLDLPSAANTWCSKYRNKSLEKRIKTGAHSPGMFRVQGPFSNSPDFANDFVCPLGTAMNPVKKCKVWWSWGRYVDLLVTSITHPKYLTLGSRLEGKGKTPRT